MDSDPNGCAGVWLGTFCARLCAPGGQEQPQLRLPPMVAWGCLVQSRYVSVFVELNGA